MAQQSLPHSNFPNRNGVSRREFLNYFLGASALTIAAGSCGLIGWLLTPQRRLNDPAGGLFALTAQDIPRLGAAPLWNREAWAWLVATENGLVALYGDCVFDHFHYLWNAVNERYECPVCGSKFEKDGTYIEGPARRDLDRFLISVTTNDGTIVQSANGVQVSTGDFQQVLVDTHVKTPGQSRRADG